VLLSFAAVRAGIRRYRFTIVFSASERPDDKFEKIVVMEFHVRPFQATNSAAGLRATQVLWF